MYDCNKCKYLNIKESHQLNRKNKHICLKHKKRVIHRDNTRDHYPKIVPCKECNQFIAMLVNLFK